ELDDATTERVAVALADWRRAEAALPAPAAAADGARPPELTQEELWQLVRDLDAAEPQPDPTVMMQVTEALTRIRARTTRIRLRDVAVAALLGVVTGVAALLGGPRFPTVAVVGLGVGLIVAVFASVVAGRRRGSNMVAVAAVAAARQRAADESRA